ncbi:MAG: PaaX family transcriptional regulator [Gammaproteobacteria bacterium]|nr:PaaX family transcriptional regulator [Gammaproteobacteria bacterium]
MKITPRQLILDLLLVGNGIPISAKEAVAACDVFDLAEVSARVALTRLLADGLTKSVSRGLYQLGPNAVEVAAEVGTWRNTNQRIKEWRGDDYITIHTSSLGRTDRSALSRRERAFKLLGFKELEKGLHIRPNNLAANLDVIRNRLKSLGLEPEAIICISSHFDDAVESHIKSLWDCEALIASYKKTTHQIQNWIEHADRLPLKVSAQESLLLGRAAIQQVVFDPMLPSQMFDVAQRDEFIKTVIMYDQVGDEIWRRLWRNGFMVEGLE